MRELILDASMRLFVEEGYESVTIRKIAERIEYSPATIYLYFRDRDEILFALHTIAFERLYQAQSAAREIADPMLRLRKHGELYVMFGFEHPELYDLMFIMRAPGRIIVAEEEWKMGMRSYELLRADVQACIDAGSIKGESAETISFALWSLVHGMVSLHIRDRCAMIPREHRLAMIRQSLDYMVLSLAAE